MNTDENQRPIDPQVRIGHVHLTVANLERSLWFYCGVLGFEVTQRYGTQAAFVSAGGYHHHIGLNTWESLGGITSTCQVNRTVPRRHSLPCEAGVCRRTPSHHRRRDHARGSQRPRCQRSSLPA